MEKLYTPKVALFINTSTAESPTWKRIGKGVTSLKLNYNPQTTTEQYIHESSSTTSTNSYQVALDLPLTCYAGEPVFDHMDKIRQIRGVGAEAEADVLVVYIYDKTTGEGATTYKAERNAANIAITDFGGDAGAPVVLNSTLSLNGDPTLGTCVITGGTPVFTAAA